MWILHLRSSLYPFFSRALCVRQSQQRWGKTPERVEKLERIWTENRPGTNRYWDFKIVFSGIEFNYMYSIRIIPGIMNWTHLLLDKMASWAHFWEYVNLCYTYTLILHNTKSTAYFQQPLEANFGYISVYDAKIRESEPKHTIVRSLQLLWLS